MNCDPRPFTFLIFALCLSVSLPATALSQDNRSTGPDLEATLNILIDGQRQTPARTSARLADVIKQITEDRDIGNLQVAATFSGRSAEGGTIEARGITQITIEATSDLNVVNWGLQSIRSSSEASDRRAVNLGIFRLNIVVPIVTVIRDEESGRSQSIRRFDNVQLNISQLTISKDTPTLVGSLALSDQGQVMYVVLEIREAI